jgi:hypothetical protein
LSVTNFANSSVCPENSCYNNNIPSGVQVRYPLKGHGLYLLFRM